MKARQDNDRTDHIGMVYSKIKTKLLRPIWLSVVCDENQPKHDMINHIGVVYVENDTEL